MNIIEALQRSKETGEQFARLPNDRYTQWVSDDCRHEYTSEELLAEDWEPMARASAIWLDEPAQVTAQAPEREVGYGSAPHFEAWQTGLTEAEKEQILENVVFPEPTGIPYWIKKPGEDQVGAQAPEITGLTTITEITQDAEKPFIIKERLAVLNKVVATFIDLATPGTILGGLAPCEAPTYFIGEGGKMYRQVPGGLPELVEEEVGPDIVLRGECSTVIGQVDEDAAYDRLHSCCPQCGSKKVLQHMAARQHRKEGLFDGNKCMCDDCGWVGIAHEKVKDKGEGE